MLALVVALTLSTTPRTLPSADVSITIPRLDKLDGLMAFLNRAGQSSSLLRPESWRNELHPILRLDATQPASFTEAGIDPSAPMMVAFAGQGRVTCHHVKSPKTFEARMHAAFPVAGDPWKATDSGLTLTGIAQGDRVIAGTVTKGTEVCVARSDGDAAPLLHEAAKLLAKGSALKGPDIPVGSVGVTSERGTVVLSSTGKSLTADGSGSFSQLQLEGPGSSPYPAGLSGLGTVRGQVAGPSRAAVIRHLLQHLKEACSCDISALTKQESLLAQHLTGAVYLRLDRIQIRDSLRLPSAQFFALKQAGVAEVSAPEALQPVLDAWSQWPQARKREDGYALPMEGGEVLVGLRGKQLYFANDAQALKALFEAVPAQGSHRSHGMEAAVNPGLLAQGLGQISILDVVGSSQLATLFAVATELGPVLQATDHLTVDLDGQGSREKVHASWGLKDK